jgi:vanillate O-demethylase monooxygenase subunit
MFLRNCWYVAAWDHELDDERIVARRILNEAVLLYRTSDGKAAALLDRCPHRLAPLSAGRRSQDTIHCGYHGLAFASDGRCVHIPGQRSVPAVAKVKTYPTSRRHGYVWIWMGAPESADSNLIPDVPWSRLEGWAAADGYTHFAADYRLLTDNLLDLSHETYLHDGTIGNQSSQTIADYPVKVSIVDTQVIRAHREMPNIDPPPFFAMILNTNGRIDRWQTAIWTAPASISLIRRRRRRERRSSMPISVAYRIS